LDPRLKPGCFTGPLPAPDHARGRAMLLIAIQPGPVLTVYRDGQEVVAVPLDRRAALGLIHDLAGALRWP